MRYIPASTAEEAPKVSTVGTVGTDVLAMAPGGDIEARTPGWASIVGYDAQGKVVEFIALAISTPDSLAIFDTSSITPSSTLVGGSVYTIAPPPTTELALEKNQSRVLAAVSRSNGVPLAGRLPYAWRSSAPSIASVEYDMMQRANIRAIAVGHATIFVESDGLATSMEVEVTDADRAPPTVPN